MADQQKHVHFCPKTLPIYAHPLLHRIGILYEHCAFDRADESTWSKGKYTGAFFENDTDKDERLRVGYQPLHGYERLLSQVRTRDAKLYINCIVGELGNALGTRDAGPMVRLLGDERIRCLASIDIKHGQKGKP